MKPGGRVAFACGVQVRARPSRHFGKTRGLTLIELMVALVLSLIVIGAAAAALLGARRGFSSIDAAGQLQDNARFATDLVQRLVAQGGYLDDAYSAQTQGANMSIAGMPPEPIYVQGFDNAIGPIGGVAVNGSRAGGCPASAGTGCNNGSDILVVRFQAAQAPDALGSDGTMINCMGDTVKGAPKKRDDLAVSVLHVQVGGDGEPSLMCSVGSDTQPVVQGVEGFQVLYGVDGVKPHTKTPTATVRDGVAERYLRADEMVVNGDPAATTENWRRVRSVRIGLVLRGPAGSLAAGLPTPMLYPLGESMSSASDAGTRFTPAANGRLRQTVAFTVHLHNAQGL
jgi:type IV pilus assembly protein PilW